MERLILILLVIDAEMHCPRDHHSPPWTLACNIALARACGWI